ncbi:MAG: hypothetical protein COA38_20875 [Fluviicola sp.]|nr:MAG: hypothetical protein COA38_20875 [Fluviicola sp.]
MKYLIFSILFISILGRTYAQVDYSGTNFWFNSCIVNNTVTSNNIVRIIGDVATNGNVSVPGTSFSQDFCFNSGGAYIDVFIPLLEYGLTSSNQIQNTAIHVVSDNEIMVVYFPKSGVNSDYYLALPSSSLDQEYYVNMPKGSGFWNPTYTQVTASENLTTINITNSSSELGPYAWGVGNNIALNTTTSIILNQGESYRIQAGQDVSTGPASNLQFSGTQFISDKPVFVSSTLSTNLPDLSIPYTDQLRVAALPKSNWGINYYTVPFLLGQAYFIQILSTDNGNVISMDGTTVATLNQYEVFDTIVSNPAHFTSSFPTNIVQCSLSKNYTSAVVGDPSQFNLISESDFDIEFHDFLQTYGAELDSVNYLMTVKTSDIPSTTINGIPVSPSSFIPISGTIYSHGVIPKVILVGLGQFLTFSSTSPMMVYKTAMQTSLSSSLEWQLSRNLGRLQNVPNSNVYDPVTCTLVSILPVEMEQFSGKSEVDVNNLAWRTASEYQNDHFLLERSTDGMHFKEIVIISGAHNSNQPLDYSFIDRTMEESINYYRLSMVDLDGNVESHGIISLVSPNLSELRIFPNPADYLLSINLENSKGTGSWDLKIVDFLGTEHLRAIISSNSSHSNLDISMLSPGVYQLVLERNGIRLIERFIRK